MPLFFEKGYTYSHFLLALLEGEFQLCMKSYTFAGTIFLDNLTVSKLKSRTGGGIILSGDIGTRNPIFPQIAFT